MGGSIVQVSGVTARFDTKCSSKSSPVYSSAGWRTGRSFSGSQAEASGKPHSELHLPWICAEALLLGSAKITDFFFFLEVNFLE